MFVSVDENILNERSGENDARAVLLLENIGEILKKNGDDSQPIYGKLDEQNIALMGHSRGGEMIADAYLFNEYDAYPSNGMFTFDYHYKIRALIAVAPSVNQYLPAGQKTGITLHPRSISPVRITDNSIRNGESMISEDRFPCG